MSNRITMANLEGVVRRLNEITASPQSTYVKDSSGKFIAQIGNYHLDGAYGGWKLMRIVGEGGGVQDVLHSGYVSKRELYNLIHAYLNGICEEKSHE